MDNNIEKEIALKKVRLLYKKLSLKYDIPLKEIENIIRSPYKFSLEKIKELDLKSVKDKNVKTNFIYKYLCKYYVHIDKLIRKNNK